MRYPSIIHSTNPGIADDAAAAINNPEWIAPHSLSSTAIIAIAGAANLTIERYHLCTGAADYIVTLPNAVGLGGKSLFVWNNLNAGKLLTIKSAGGTVAGVAAATGRISWTGESSEWTSDGTNWWRTGGTLIPMMCKMYMSANQGPIAQFAHVLITLDSTAYDNSGLMADITNKQMTFKRTEQYQAQSAIPIAAVAGAAAVVNGIIWGGAAATVPLVGLNPTKPAVSGTGLTPNGLMTGITAGDKAQMTLYSDVALTIGGGTVYQTQLSITEIISW